MKSYSVFAVMVATALLVGCDQEGRQNLGEKDKTIKEFEERLGQTEDGKPQTPAEPVLIACEFFSHTNDDNKDKDTGVYVTVTTNDRITELAKAENKDNSSNDDTEYIVGSDHSFPLVVLAPGTPKSECVGFIVRIHQTTNGNDTWTLNGKVTLTFSDQNTLIARNDRMRLEDDGASDTFSPPR